MTPERDLSRLLLAGIVELVQSDEHAARSLAAALAPCLPNGPEPAPPSPYMTPVEAAAYLRCKRQRIYDLLGKRRLARFKDGSRTLVSRAEVEAIVREEQARRVQGDPP